MLLYGMAKSAAMLDTLSTYPAPFSAISGRKAWHMATVVCMFKSIINRFASGREWMNSDIPPTPTLLTKKSMWILASSNCALSKLAQPSCAKSMSMPRDWTLCCCAMRWATLATLSPGLDTPTML